MVIWVCCVSESRFSGVDGEKALFLDDVSTPLGFVCCVV